MLLEQYKLLALKPTSWHQRFLSPSIWRKDTSKASTSDGDNFIDDTITSHVVGGLVCALC